MKRRGNRAVGEAMKTLRDEDRVPQSRHGLRRGWGGGALEKLSMVRRSAAWASRVIESASSRMMICSWARIEAGSGGTFALH